MERIVFKQPVSCNDCIGACCLANTVLPLTKKESDSLQDAGTLMSELPKEEYEGNRPGFRRKFWLLESPCGNLVDNPDPINGPPKICKVYGTSERPKVCNDVKVGGFVCLDARARRLPQSDK